MHRSVLGKTTLEVSRLGLGTAEIGFAYGLGTPVLPSEEEAVQLLKTAVELGVTFFDTAQYYGLAEERIGKSEILQNPDVVVCTKCAQFLEKGEELSNEEIEKKIREQVAQSLAALGLSTLSILMLHGPSALQLEDGFLLSVIKKLQTEGLIEYWGTSTRGEEPALAAIMSGADVIQIAYSIADQRMAKKVFPSAEQAGVGVVNRSVYLKGVFAGKAELLPAQLTPLKEAVTKAKEVADELGVSLTELALRFSLSQPAISTTLVGTAKIAHLESAAQAIARGPLPESVIQKLYSLAIVDPGQVDPARWPK
jgi:L-galactose dehydrogenase